MPCVTSTSGKDNHNFNYKTAILLETLVHKSETEEKRTIRQNIHRRIDLRRLLVQFAEIMDAARSGRPFSRDLFSRSLLLNELRKAKQEAGPNEKPKMIKTNLRNLIILREMCGSVIGVYNGRSFTQVKHFYLTIFRHENFMFIPVIYRLKSSRKWSVIVWRNFRWPIHDGRQGAGAK